MKINKFFVMFLLAASLPSMAVAFINQVDQNSDQPIEILADDGIACDENQGHCTATGNVRAKRGDYTLTCKVLKAFFAKDAEGHQQITRLEAEGGVHMTSTHPEQHRKAWGERVIYQEAGEMVTLLGPSSRVESEDMVITAKERIDYSNSKQIAHAIGQATAYRQDRVVQADTLTAYFEKDKDDKSSLKTVDGLGHVVLTTPQEIATGERGHYNATEERAELHGNVRVTNCDGQLEGASAEVNLKDHTSRILEPHPIASNTDPKPKRARALLLPRPKKDKDSQ